MEFYLFKLKSTLIKNFIFYNYIYKSSIKFRFRVFDV